MFKLEIGEQEAHRSLLFYGRRSSAQWEFSWMQGCLSYNGLKCENPPWGHYLLYIFLVNIIKRVTFEQQIVEGCLVSRINSIDHMILNHFCIWNSALSRIVIKLYTFNVIFRKRKNTIMLRINFVPIDRSSYYHIFTKIWHSVRETEEVTVLSVLLPHSFSILF